MIIKIGDKYFNSEENEIIIALSQREVDIFKGFAPGDERNVTFAAFGPKAFSKERLEQIVGEFARGYEALKRSNNKKSMH